MRKFAYLFVLSFYACSCEKVEEKNENEDVATWETQDIIDLTKWKLVWQDEFAYDNPELEGNWISQNGETFNQWVLCSRWRENALVHDGILELFARKENRAGQDWTCGNIWTKETFGYGYFECRYKYAGATGTNNSFWLWPMNGVPPGGSKFEVDINEGHYPNEVNTNIHNRSDTWVENGVTKHATDPKAFTFGSKPVYEAYSHKLDAPITTKKIRFSSTHGAHFHIREFRIYAPNSKGYPQNVLSETADTDISSLINHARAPGTTITASGEYETDNQDTSPKNVADGKVKTSSWIAQAEGEKWLEFEWTEDKTVGAIQFVNGWLSGTTWKALITNYKIQYYDGIDWVDIVDFDSVNGVDFSEEYHTYGLVWSPTRHDFYFDGELFRSVPHTDNHSKTNILLSLAILKNGIGGAVTDAIDGTSMKIDYVRYYQPK